MGKQKKKYTYIPEKETYFHNSAFCLEIKQSQINGAGMGVYTLDFIPNHSFIDYYIGDFCKYPLSKYFIEIDHNFGIDAGQFPRCYMAMINDSHNSEFTNNCEIRINDNNVEIWSIINILIGEELFISYGNEYWN